MDEILLQKKPSVAHYIFQPMLVIGFLLIVLSVFYATEHSNALWAVAIGSLASSAYIVFTKPSVVASHPARMVAAYVIAILSGVITHIIGWHFFTEHETVVAHMSFFQMGFLTAIAVGIALWLMLWFHAEHPPAAGTALIMVLDVNDYITPIIVISAVIFLVISKYLLHTLLKDLS